MTYELKKITKSPVTQNFEVILHTWQTKSEEGKCPKYLLTMTTTTTTIIIIIIILVDGQ
jgi:hypothetical protein